jgi:hypothetical protein
MRKLESNLDRIEILKKKEERELLDQLESNLDRIEIESAPLLSFT